MRRGCLLYLREVLLIAPAVWIVLILSQGSARAAAPEQKPVVDLKVVKYNDLVEVVKAQRGKVVVLDVWGEF